MEFDAVVIGGGAAGLFCAIEAGRRGRSVLLMEHGDRVGRKILISGGGRCNFTNRTVRAENFLSSNPHFAKSALARYTPQQFIQRVEQHNIRWHEKTLGQLFCDRAASDIVDMLVRECDEAGVRIATSCKVEAVHKRKSYVVESSQGNIAAASVVVATGGLSIPKLGASDFAYRLAQRLGVNVLPPRPALVPLTWNAAELALWQNLAGISTPVHVTSEKRRFTESMLFTHRGLSGPALLQISSYWREGEAIRLDLLPDLKGDDIFLPAKQQRDRRDLKHLLYAWLPQRLADRWCAVHPEKRPAFEIADAELRKFAAALHSWNIVPAGTEGYEKAEVTAGGIDTGELSSQTMECRQHPGLYFIGEAVDVTGWLGGYNFQWAWASAYAAGQDV